MAGNYLTLHMSSYFTILVEMDALFAERAYRNRPFGTAEKAF